MKYLILVFVLIFSACSTKDYAQTKTKIVIIKSPLIKFADIGYIRNTDDKVSLELFIAGQRIQKIDINHLICVDEGCLTKSGFNKDYLNEDYPDEILQNILLARPIFEAKNLIKTDDGFVQKIITENMEIKYRVSSNVTFFKDLKNRIIFKIKEID